MSVLMAGGGHASEATSDPATAMGTLRFDDDTPSAQRQHPPMDASVSNGAIDVLCGPLLNYKHMGNAHGSAPTWNGSVLLVAKPGEKIPVLQLRCVGRARGAWNEALQPRADGDDGDGPDGSPQVQEEQDSLENPPPIVAFQLLSDPVKAFWRFNIQVPLQAFEAQWEYTILGLRFVSAGARASRDGRDGDDDIDRSTRAFVVPAASQSMRIMFHSCNGFSVSVDVQAWSGQALWHDVLRMHHQQPFHVMIGGGDQIYNDGVRVTGPLREWAALKNPIKKREYPFSEDLSEECDSFYFENYVRWFSMAPFATANGQIAQINVWDDHDIIDGYGSYTDNFMSCAVFRGIGDVALKYYLLFQHHSPPPPRTYATEEPHKSHRPHLHHRPLRAYSAPDPPPSPLAPDADATEGPLMNDRLHAHHRPPRAYSSRDPPTRAADADATDEPHARHHRPHLHHRPPRALSIPEPRRDEFVLAQGQPEVADPCWIEGAERGPYIRQRSRSVFCHLGPSVAFVGVDARTERSRHEINFPSTYDRIFQRLEAELGTMQGRVQHLIVLLGIPIAYPRLNWLENILRSPLIGPIRFLNKRFGLAAGFFNAFDDEVEILDDLDDHYTARQHKAERKALLVRLQRLAERHRVRVTILGGDVHLAACGRFYANARAVPGPSACDHRYMVNLISSAITNQPPPAAIANLMARRNKIHHLNRATDETLMPLFDRAPGGVVKAAGYNRVTMPSRNYAILTETSRGADGAVDPLTGRRRPLTANGYHAALPNGHTALADPSPLASPASASASAAAVAVALGSFAHPSRAKDGRSPLHPGEEQAGTWDRAASGLSPPLLRRRRGPGADSGAAVPGLDLCVRVEIDAADPEGRTQGAGVDGD
ncbi:MAG: hypothetical protein M1826_005977 [Phylliscum demangeonii]|nr:MAG: hypothetical protein M1826_005977 [Phylliscum demangeonii]